MLQKNFFIVGHLRVAESTGTPDTLVWSISLERVDAPIGTWTQGGQLEVDARGMHVNGLRQRQPLLNLSRRLLKTADIGFVTWPRAAAMSVRECRARAPGP